MRTGTLLLPPPPGCPAGASPRGPPGAACTGTSDFIPGRDVSQFPPLSAPGLFCYFCPNPTSFLPRALLNALSVPTKKQWYRGRRGGAQQPHPIWDISGGHQGKPCPSGKGKADFQPPTWSRMGVKAAYPPGALPRDLLVHGGGVRMTPATLPTRQSAPRSPWGGFTRRPQPLQRKHHCNAKLCSELLQLPRDPVRSHRGKRDVSCPPWPRFPAIPPGPRAQG